MGCAESWSDGGVAKQLGLQPTVFYTASKKAFFENRARPSSRANASPVQVEQKQKRVEFLEKKVQTKDEVLTELMAEHIALKKVLGSAEHGVGAARCAGPGGGFRPALVGKAEIGAGRFIHWLGVPASKFYNWRERCGPVTTRRLHHRQQCPHMLGIKSMSYVITEF